MSEIADAMIDGYRQKLLDEFAKAALTGILANVGWNITIKNLQAEHNFTNEQVRRFAAVMAYDYANEMMEIRDLRSK